MSILYTSCKKGDDSPCKATAYGDDGCCAMVKCTDAPSGDLTTEQQAIKDGFTALGYPTEKGKDAHVCSSLSALREAE